MVARLAVEEWFSRYSAALGGNEEWPAEPWAARALEQLVAAGLSPEAVAASVLEVERQFLEGSPPGVAPRGLLAAR